MEDEGMSVHECLKKSLRDLLPDALYEMNKLPKEKSQSLENCMMFALEIFWNYDEVLEKKKELTVGKQIFRILDSSYRYNHLVNLQNEFVEKFLAISGIVSLFMYCIEKYKISAKKIKNIFQSYFFSEFATSEGMSYQCEESKEEVKTLSTGGKIINVKGGQADNKIILFGNLFEMLSKWFVKQLSTYDIFPILAILNAHIQFIPSNLLDSSKYI